MNRQMEIVRLDRCKSTPTETRTFFWLAPEISALVWKSVKVSIRPFFCPPVEFFAHTLEEYWQSQRRTGNG